MTTPAGPSAATDLDRRFMGAAIRLARRNLGLTAPNPSVGAICVAASPTGPIVVGRGVTAPGGRPHAEPQALAEAGARARGATLYVTLEPCSHHGRTPPCVDAILAAGIARVVVARDDPDPRVAGRGYARLVEAGVEVVRGVEAEAAFDGLAAFLTRVTRDRPEVLLKLAVSADGMIGRPGVPNFPITGPAARARAQTFRAEADAIAVGIATAALDDPELTVRLPGMAARTPLRVVFDRDARLAPTSRLARSATEVPVRLLTAVGLPPVAPGERPRSVAPGERHPPVAPGEHLPPVAPGEHLPPVAPGERSEGRGPTPPLGASRPPLDPLPLRPSGSAAGDDGEGRLAALSALGVEASVVRTGPDGRLDLDDALRRLAAIGINALMVEGGAVLAESFLAAGLVDRVALFRSPVVVGEGGVPAPASLAKALAPEGGLRIVGRERWGDDLLEIWEGRGAARP